MPLLKVSADQTMEMTELSGTGNIAEKNAVRKFCITVKIHYTYVFLVKFG